ncbi:MAG: hypothetical protein [Bacteriophage sp.]|jgi:hypothetical protein|nr:MAG: hypothetical protein [Bacteriophage sp.]
MGKSKGNNGSELHRLKPMQEYDEATFNRLYKVCKPVIRNLTRQIDYKRFNLTPDIIQSYFWDKMLFVFNKYYGECTEEHLKARILASLSTFKNKLLRSAYGEQAEYNQSLFKLDDLFDNDKELEDDTEEEKAKSEMLDMMYTYMKDKLSPDAYLLFEVLITPPPFIKERLENSTRITNIMLIEFFEMPKTNESMRYISELRQDIQYWEDRAKEELRY